MTLKYAKEIYSKAALVKAAFQFTDRAYLYLFQDDAFYYVEVTPKNGELSMNFDNEFGNEMLAQTVHVMVADQTSQLRSILMGRALSSSMILNAAELPEEEDQSTPNELDSILKDWFEQDEEDRI